MERSHCFPGYQHHRAVARLLRTEVAGMLPWHRIVGAGGEIKLRFEAAEEQRLRLKMEGVKASRQARRYGSLRTRPPQLGETLDREQLEHER